MKDYVRLNTPLPPELFPEGVDEGKKIAQRIFQHGGAQDKVVRHELQQ